MTDNTRLAADAALLLLLLVMFLVANELAQLREEQPGAAEAKPQPASIRRTGLGCTNAFSGGRVLCTRLQLNTYSM